jgi:starch-binding outer membrane protein, SusD/RagB family
MISTGVILILGSCSDWLDLKPESEILLDNFWQSESQATSVVAGCYKSLTSDGCMSRMVLWGEGRSDNVDFDITDDNALKKMVRFDISPSNTYCSWGPFYTVINYCNTFLYYAPGVLEKDPTFTLAHLQQLQAEVLTIRALSYFYLVRVFKNVPWIGTPSLNDEQDFTVGQSTERAVIDSLISNLKTALIFAPTQYATTESSKGRITKNAVRALLADIYLWDQQYANCISMCNAIIDDKDLKLVSGEKSLHNIFYLGNSSESIFELQFGETSDKQYNNIVKKYYGSYDVRAAALVFSSFLVKGTGSPFNLSLGNALESENDIRLKDDIDLSSGTTSGIYPIFKYAGNYRIESQDGKSSYYGFRNNSANWIIYRKPDVMLMKAEALVQNNDKNSFKSALELVNTVYLRSNTVEGTDSLQFSNYQTKEQFEKLVLRERQRELLFEGKRWFDLMRYARRAKSVGALLEFVSGKLSDGTGTQISSKSVMDALYLPVNQTDMDSNSKLIQNPYYEESSNN